MIPMLVPFLMPFWLTPAQIPLPAQTPATPPAVTEVRIDKSDHRLDLVASGQIIKTYTVAIGSGGLGPKRFEGDKTTPVGTYRIAGRFRGLFHQFLTVS